MPQVDYGEIGRRIAFVRHLARITQREFAGRIGISAGMLGKIERGAKGSLSIYLRICDAFHLTMDFLLLGKESPEVQDKVQDALAALHSASSAIKRIQT